MTAREAIELLSNTDHLHEPPNGYYEALDMAIEALQEQSRDCMWVCPNCGLDVHVDYDRCVRCGERREP